tara:strand:- start:494 stop:1714 length:1221 start_codon:yes stop_codon:yes gene_type:complete
MSDNKRTLKINPELFALNGRKNKKEKSRKIKPLIDEENSSKTNKVKKELMKKVKDYQKNKEQEKIAEEKKETNILNSNIFEEHKFENTDFEREFNTSLNFLQDLAKKNREKKRKKTIKNNSAIEIEMELPTNLSNNEPNYGCLKNGTKPTYNQLNKTQKNNDNRRIKIVLENNDTGDNNYNNIIEKNETKNETNNETKNETNNETNNEIKNETNNETKNETINDTKNTMREDEDFTQLMNDKIEKINNLEINTTDTDLPKDIKNLLNNETNNLKINEKLIATQDLINTDLKDSNLLKLEEINYDKLPKINRVTRKKKYKLGKIKGNNHVGVLIKNRDTQKNIKNEIGLLRTKSIQEIKDYLRQKNLIKVGTEAPNDVIRKIYEDSIISGDIENNNDSNMVHNFLNY